MKLWLGFLVVILAGLGLAWAGAQSVRSRTVQVHEVKQGAGPTIQPQDGVLIEYEGRLPDGKLFDSSNGQAVPLLASQVIPGFAEGLSRMQEGGRYKLHIPARLAYGSTPPPGIPRDSDLDFDVRIVKVVPNAAAMMQSMQGGSPQH